MIINPYLVVPGTPPYDPDAQAFITATGLTTPTQQNTINELVLDLKSANIWTKFNALYPMITDKVTQVDIANQMKFNLKNPLDTNGAFRLNWVGGWVWSTNGATPNGTNSYANTFLSTATNLSLNSGHLSYYSRTNSLSAGTVIEIGTLKPTPDSYSDLVLSSANTTYFRFNNTTTFNTVATSNTEGFYVGTRTASNIIKTFKSGVNIINGTAPSSATSTVPFFIGASNNNGTPQFYSTKQCAFASIGSGLTDLEAQLFYQIVGKYQVALSRNINPTQSFYYNRNYGNETNAYLFATQITNTTQQVAIGTFIGELKSYNIWTKMRAVYPMITDKTLQVDMANQMKYNLVNPQDLNDAFRITWAGGLTYSSNGVISNGSSGYGNTNFTPSVHAPSSQNNVHISIYSRTDIAQNANDIGSAALLLSQAQYLTMYLRTAGNLFYPLANVPQSGVGGANVANTDSRGLFIANRTTSLKGFRNNVKLLDNATASQTILNIPLFIGALNNAGSPSGYSTRQIAFASIGDGLTDAEASNFYTAVQNLQTTLGRQV